MGQMEGHQGNEKEKDGRGRRGTYEGTGHRRKEETTEGVEEERSHVERSESYLLYINSDNTHLIDSISPSGLTCDLQSPVKLNK